MPDSEPPNNQPSELPELLPIGQVRERLNQIFPGDFPDRGILVGSMASRVVYVFLYGRFVGDLGHYLRPSYVYFFTDKQAAKTSTSERLAWLASAGKAGFRPMGKRWYADTSRESIRDDLMRNTMLRLGLAHKRPGVPVNSSKPIWYLDQDFAELFESRLSGRELDRKIAEWCIKALDIGTLQRMALTAQGAHRREGEVFIDLPDGTRIRTSAGPSSLITKDLIEQYAVRHLKNPVVLWISASDKKASPQFVALAASVGLNFDLSAELPDLILADLSDPTRFVFCEVVATDGPMTEARKQALIDLIARKSRIPLSRLSFVTAYEDRNAAPFKKNFSRLAYDSFVWFRTEPDLLVHLSKLKERA